MRLPETLDLQGSCRLHAFAGLAGAVPRQGVQAASGDFVKQLDRVASNRVFNRTSATSWGKDGKLKLVDLLPKPSPPAA